MLPNAKILDTFIYILLCLLLKSHFSSNVESDVNCLRAIKTSLGDPLNSLATWDFSKVSEGSICNFSRIECWHPSESRVLNIKLSGLGLKGPFPRGIANCSSLTGLDLSRNNISGNIPSDISSIIKYVTNLDLSSNRLSGQIPGNLANCSYLNVIRLDNNEFTGQIPLQISLLDRVKEFSVSNNMLTGPVPNFRNASITADSYANNVGLCGGPLPPCQGSKKNRAGVIIGAAAAGLVFAILGVAIGTFFFMHRVSRKKKIDDPEDNKWAKDIKGTRSITRSDLKKEKQNKTKKRNKKNKGIAGFSI